MNKRLLLCIMLASSLLVEAGISSKYSEGYEFTKSQVSENGDANMSLYKDSSVIYVRDGKVYVSTIDTASGDLSDAKLCSDFELLSISGTVAYDLKRNRIYYSQYNESRKADYLYESIADENGKWQVGTRLRVQGTNKERTSVNFVQSAGWNYRKPYLSGFYNPVMSSNYNRIYFSSSMEGGKGGRDIYYVEIEDETQRIWSLPQALSTLNSDSDDDYAYINGDSLMYFSSKRSGTTSIYVSKNQNDTWTDPELMDYPYNEDNSYNMLLQDSAPMLISERSGSSNIYLYNKIPEPEVIPEVIPEPEPEPEPTPAPTYEEKKSQFYWVFFLFDFDKDILGDKFKSELDKLANEMREFPDARFEITGYTDSRGTVRYNDELSQRRADTIKRMLISKGFKEQDLVSIGWGERRLQVPDAQTEDEHAQNRRVEVRIIMDKK